MPARCGHKQQPKPLGPENAPNRFPLADASTVRRPRGRDEGNVAVEQRGLVERAARGDQDAFAVLVRASIDRLDIAARLIVRDPELARDAVQDGLIRAWRDLRGLRDPDRFEAWLHRLTVNACLDQLRRRRRRPIEIEITDLVTAHEPDPADALAERDAVDRVLRTLDDRGRAIVVLHYYLGIPLTEVAATLGIPTGTVKSRLHRALGDMRAAGVTNIGTATLSSGERSPA
jgi:RNA polymerase sigma-70 factor, ECF subfamily